MKSPASPTYVRGRFLQGGSARNPWKTRSWIQQKYGSAFDASKIQNAYAVDPVNLNNRHDTRIHLENGGIPNPGSYKTRLVGESFIKITTTVSGRDLRKLQKLKKRLDGVTSFDSLSKNASYEIHVIFPDIMQNGKTFRCAMEEIASVYHVYAHIRRHSRENSIPYYFGGLHPGLGAYVAVISAPPKTIQIPRGDRVAVDVFKRLVSIGAYPMSSNVVRIDPGTKRYIVSDPWQIREIPRGIFSSFTRSKVMASKGHGKAWVDAGGAAWAAEIKSSFSFERTNLTMKNDDPVTLQNTMNTVLKRSILRYQTGPSTKKILDRETHDAVTKIQSFSTRIGSGSYGDVFVIDLDRDGMRSAVLKIFKNLKNMTNFESIKRKKIIIMKIEKLDRLTPLTKPEVYRLAGEAYVQNYVHHGVGMGKRGTEIAPAVFFSGTLANRLHVIAMQYIPGETLESFINRRKFIPLKLHTNIDHAVKEMLRNGVVHSDLHGNNILINPRSFTVKIIDFGFATILPPGLHDMVLEVLDRGGTVQNAFKKTGLLDTIDASKFEYSFYHSNMKMVKRIRKLRNRAPLVGLRSHRLKNQAKSPISVANGSKKSSSTTTSTNSTNSSGRRKRRNSRSR